MLTRLTVRNFKRFGELVVDLGNPVIFIGPNNSGKTSAMQALALWDVGLKRWNERRGGRKTPEKRPGVTVNRRDLVSIPVPEANLLWRNLRVRDVRSVDGRQRTSNIRIDIVVDGVTDERAWTCGLEFDYANEESFYCRPLRVGGGSPERMAVPEAAAKGRIAFLPPMSGLAATEARLDAGSVNVRIGEGRTAEVLRNLCYSVHREREDQWEQLVAWIRRLFGAELLPPRYLPERGEITMSYREGGTALDLSSSGRGLQQTLLLLAYLYANPGSLLLLDEPDAHLEILRQRQTYHLLSEVARDTGCQVIAASHSEVILNEAAGRDTVIAFVGAPHRIADRGSQALKALTEIGFEQYFHARETGWVLYLRSSTDLAVLLAFARRLGHEAASEALSRPFVRYVANNASEVTRHYHALREAVPALRGIALFDRVTDGPPDIAPVECLVWERREVENYLCTRRTLEAYAAESSDVDRLGSLFAPPEVERRRVAMNDAIAEVEKALAADGTAAPWSTDLRAGEQVLEPIVAAFFRQLDLPSANRGFQELVEHVPEDEIAPEIAGKLDAIARVAAGPSPAPEP
ncbi:MAG: AAA family ATPase [Spirochaetaceae bacterium]|nr:AAA family ATPase [Spirochaetaceae bacterium]